MAGRMEKSKRWDICPYEFLVEFSLRDEEVFGGAAEKIPLKTPRRQEIRKKRRKFMNMTVFPASARLPGNRELGREKFPRA